MGKLKCREVKSQSLYLFGGICYTFSHEELMLKLALKIPIQNVYAACVYNQEWETHDKKRALMWDPDKQQIAE